MQHPQAESTISPKRIYDEAELAGIKHVMLIGYNEAGSFHMCSNIDTLALRTHLLELARHFNLQEDLDTLE